MPGSNGEMNGTVIESRSVNRATADSLVFGQTNQGAQIRGTLVRLTRHEAVFEMYNPGLTLRVSEVLNEFRILVRDFVTYAGRAVVRTVLNTGSMMICEVTLTEHSWSDVVMFPSQGSQKDSLCLEFKEFVHNWQRQYRIAAEYKVIVADIQSFLNDLRLWLDQVELGIRSSPSTQRANLENEIAHELSDSVIRVMNGLLDRFEEVSDTIEEELRPAHRAFGQRQLHPLMLCSPFMYRTYTKPLGYAGDYEMMNMIMRNGYEGSSLFAKLVNAYLLNQAPPRAVRSRVRFLNSKIVQEANRVARLGRVTSVYSIGCGPAREAEEFVAENPLADRVQFRLMDFNEETLHYARSRMDETVRSHHRRTSVTLVKNTVQRLLRGGGVSTPEEQQHDLIYCSGLYDYLNNRIIKALNTYLYDQLKPGGLLVTGNFAPWTPRQNLMEHLSEWFLIYRGNNELATLAPDQAAPEDCTVCAESSGCNIFLEVRKPR